MRNFFNELKRRNVIKETLAYLVISWVLLQVASIILPIINAPDWVLKTVTFFLAIGLPVWIFFSWAYQVTPEGIKRTAKFSEDQTITTATNKRLNIIILITLLIAIGVSFVNKTKPKVSAETMVSNELTLDNSIAVLPFADYSPGKDQAWFTDGMTDALITELSKISSLNVRSRTSVMQYKGTNKTISEIARELNVGTIIEGSAVKVNDSVRITAQLISAADKHLWANNYDAGMKDVLRLHHNIAKAITKEINVVLTPADLARFTVPSRVNPAAFEADLKGMHIFKFYYTFEEIKKAGDYFKMAISLDSTYAPAYAHHAGVYLNYPYFGEKNPLESWQLAEDLNKTALRLDPDLELTYLNQFFYLYYIKWDWDGALRALAKAEELAPNNLEVLQNLSSYYVASGKFGKAFETCEKMHQIDPTDQVYWWRKAFIQFHSRDLEGSLKTIDEGLELFPDFYGLLSIQSWCLSALGRHKEAVNSYKEFLSLIDGSSVYYQALSGWIFGRAGLKEEALKELKIFEGSGNYSDPVIIGMIYMAIGDIDRAMEYYQKGYREHSLQLPYLKRSPAWDPMRGDPRFEKLIQDLKFP